ncbi:MAG: hypothetical protein ACMUIU_02245 [bacterium]
MGCRGYSFRKNNFLNREALVNMNSVAVLPFHNISESLNAGVIISNMIIAELVREDKFSVVKYGDVRNFFLQRRLTSVSTIDVETLRALRQEFKVDIVIIGTVLHYEDDEGIKDRNRENRTRIPYVAITSTILDTRSGRIVGKGEFVERGSAKGYLLTNKQRQDTFSLAQKLAQRLVAVINTDGA